MEDPGKMLGSPDVQRPTLIRAKVGNFECQLDDHCCGWVKLNGNKIACKGFSLVARVGRPAELVVDLVPGPSENG